MLADDAVATSGGVAGQPATILSSNSVPNHATDEKRLKSINIEAAKLNIADVSARLIAPPTENRQSGMSDDADDAMSDGAATQADYDMGDSILDQQTEVGRLQAENRHLTSQVQQLRHEIQRLQQITAGNASAASLCNSIQMELIQANQELSRSKETLRAMKADRKRLKTEKADLVGQMKQLYGTLKDKESELRDFIRSYEQRNRDMLDNIKQLVVEKEDLQRQLTDALSKADEATEQCAALRVELERRNDGIGKSQIQFNRPTDVLSAKMTLPNNNSMNESMRSKSSRDGDGPFSSSGEELPPYQDIYLIGGQAGSASPPALPRTASLSEGQKRAQQIAQRLRMLSQRVPRTTLTPVRHQGRGTNSPMSPVEQEPDQMIDQPRRHNSFTGTMSSGVYSSVSSTESQLPSRYSCLTQRNYPAKLHALEEARALSVTEWKAHHVVTWLELDMNMSNYGQACVDNIKSGKILLGLSDSELETALRLESVLHRRKLRLAIEELRDPSTVQYRNASKIGHHWVAHEWLDSLGLPQYSKTFESQLVDARLLNVISKKDLDKHLGVHRKSHQSSILYGVQLLRMVNFDREALLHRRANSQEDGGDPLYWTNFNVKQWADKIDLQEYSEKLNESGVHGAVMVLDQSFTPDVFAAILGIPASKSYVRRHLATEVDSIIRPARAKLESPKKGGSLSRSALTRSYSAGAKSDGESSNTRGSGRRFGLRGSFGRAFGRKSTKDSSSATPSPSTSKESKLSSAESASSVDLRPTRS